MMVPWLKNQKISSKWFCTKYFYPDLTFSRNNIQRCKEVEVKTKYCRKSAMFNPWGLWWIHQGNKNNFNDCRMFWIWGYFLKVSFQPDWVFRDVMQFLLLQNDKRNLDHINLWTLWSYSAIKIYNQSLLFLPINAFFLHPFSTQNDHFLINLEKKILVISFLTQPAYLWKFSYCEMSRCKIYVQVLLYKQFPFVDWFGLGMEKKKKL